MKFRYILLQFIILIISITTVNAQCPPSGFNVVFPTVPCAPTPVSFVVCTPGAISCTWAFSGGAQSSSSGLSVINNFITGGTYTVTATIITGSGTTTTTQSFTIHDPPSICFTATPTNGCAPLSVQFNDCSTGDGPITNRLWVFCDGDSSTAVNPVNVYELEGCYCFTYIINDNLGCQSDTFINQLVCVTPPPVACFTSPNASNCSAPWTVNFDNCSTPAIGLTYNWSFPGATSTSSVLQTPTSTYNSQGSYAVTLTVTDASGCSSTLSQPSFVNIGNGQTSLSINDSTICAGQTVFLSGGAANSYTWTPVPASGQGTNSASFIFPTAGTYTITYNVVLPGGCLASKQQKVFVSPEPIANFTLTPQSACIGPLTITPTNLTTGTGWTYEWQFPGGTPSTSTLQTPGSIVYNNCGVYNVTLIVSGLGGCKDTFVYDNAVIINCANGNFEIDFSDPAGLICAPATVNFNAIPDGVVGLYTYCWDFNYSPPGNFSSNCIVGDPLTTFTFNTPGCYSIALKIFVTNSVGCSTIVIKPDLICIGEDITDSIEFSIDPDTACAPELITLTVENPPPFVPLADCPLTYTVTDWGDGGTSQFTAPNTTAMHMYTDTGTFDITLVRCACSCCDTLIKEQIITIEPPITKLTLSRTCENPLCIICTTTGSIGVDNFDWIIPSTGTITDAVLSATGDTIGITVCFPSPNTAYNISIDGINFATQCTMSVAQTALTTDPIPDFYFADTVLCVGESTLVYNTSINIANSYWYFFDQSGNQLGSFITNLASPPSPGTWSFSDPGIYTVQVNVTDVGGCVDTIIKTDYIEVYGVEPNFFGGPFADCIPFVASFQDSTQDNLYSTAVSYQWYFGDGDSSTSQNPNHIYDTPGFYPVTLCVTEDHGCEACTTKTAYVNASQPIVDFYATDSSICAGQQICFINNTTGSLPNYNWYVFNPVGSIIDSSTLNLPCFTFNNNGTYTIKLVATDNLGCQDSLIKVINVGSVNADFIADSTNSSCPPLPVQFTNLTPGLNSSYSCQWLFGDGSSSVICDPFYAYNIPGSYDVTLIVSNADGCTDTVFKDDYIFIGGPTASVIADIDTGCVPLFVNFDANPTNSISFNWCFGDYSSCQFEFTGITNHTYDIAGVYNASVILCDGIGCCYERPIGIIVVDSIDARFASTSYDLCSNGTVTLTDSSYSILGVSSLTWDLGDMTIVNDSTTVFHVYNTFGTYPITLTATSDAGCTSTFIDTVLVTPSPFAVIGLATPALCPGDTICFSNNSNSISLIDSFAWDFGVPGTNNDTSSLANPCYVYNNSGAYTVTLFVKAENNCFDTTTFIINIGTLPIANAGPNDAICINDSIQVIGTGGVSYSWSPSISLSNSLISDPLAFPTIQTTYTLVVTDAAGCTDDDDIVISINFLPIPTIAYDDSVCENDIVTLTAGGGVSFFWSTTETTSIITPTVTTTSTYTVTVTDINGCKKDTSAIIESLPLPTAVAYPDTAVCKNQPLQIFAEGSQFYSWSPGFLLNDSLLQNPSLIVLDTVLFTVTVTDTFGCKDDAQLLVTLLPLPPVNAGADKVICAGTSTQLNVSGAKIYDWSPSSMLNFTNISNPIATPDSFTQAYTFPFYVVGTDSVGCVNYDTVLVNLLYPFTTTFGVDSCICIGGCAQLFASVSDTNFSKNYTWTPTVAIDYPKISNPIVCPTYDITYRAIVSDLLGCDSDTGFAVICVKALPEITSSNDTLILAGGVAFLNAYSTSQGIYSWIPDSALSCGTCSSTEAQPLVITTYIVSITDQFGCRNEDTTVVSVFCSDASIYIPNAFTPNEDGLNDIYLLKGAGFDLNYLRIYNRWGMKVFESNNLYIGWDGRYNGKLYEPEVFIYYLEAVCSTGEVINKKGNITLVR
jgi:gliding motility-associated-like protein